MSDIQKVWVAYSNTDCTEGRGMDVPIAVCKMEVTAKRLARGRYVQGSDGPVRPMNLIQVDGNWYAPTALVNVIEPTKEDLAVHEAAERRRVVLEKAKSLGLTDEDIATLKGETK